MARRKAAEVEILPPEDEQPKGRGRKKLVDAEHTIKYSAPVPVEVEDDPEEIIELDGFDDRPRRKPPQNEREQLRKRLSTNGVTPTSTLKLSIERYVHTDSMDSGTQAEKAYCSKYACNEAHVTGEDYLDVARQFGPGRYWFTLRLNNKIVTQWERRLDTAPTVAAINGTTIPGGEYAAPMGYQMPAANMPAPLTFTDYLKQMAQAKKLMDEISGTAPQQNPLPSEEIQLASLLLKDPANAKKMARNLLGGEGEKDMLSLAIENGPAIIEAFGNMVLKIIGDVRNQNGQTQTPPQTFPQSGSVNGNEQTFGRIDQTQSLPQGTQGVQSGNAQVPNATPDAQILDHLFGYVIEQCQSQTNPELVAAGIDRFMDEQVSADFPLYCDKIWSQLEMFAGMETDAVLAYVRTLPNGATVAELPHAKEWTAKLQELLKPGEETEAA